MYTRRMCKPGVVLCAVVLSMLVCGWAGAATLLDEEFEGSVGLPIINYGGGNHWQATEHYEPHAVVSDTVINNGFCAFNNLSYNSYKRVDGYFTQHTLVAGESVEVTWVQKLPETDGTQSGVGLIDANNHSWRMYLARNTYDSGVTWAYEWMAYAYDSEGGQHSSSYPNWNTFAAKYGTTVDCRILITTTEARYYVKAHGAGTYDQLWSYAGGIGQVNNVELLLWGSGASYIDSIKVVTGAPPGTLTGQLELMDYTSPPADLSRVPVKVQFVPQGTGTAKTLELPLLSTNPSLYTITPLAAGTYNVTFTAAKFLSKTLTNVVIEEGFTTERDVSLINGDLDGDNSVSSTDLSILLLNLNQSGN